MPAASSGVSSCTDSTSADPFASATTAPRIRLSQTEIGGHHPHSDTRHDSLLGSEVAWRHHAHHHHAQARGQRVSTQRLLSASSSTADRTREPSGRATLRRQRVRACVVDRQIARHQARDRDRESEQAEDGREHPNHAVLVGLCASDQPSRRSRGSKSFWNSSRKRRWSWPRGVEHQVVQPPRHVLADLLDGLVGIRRDDPALGDLLDGQRVGGLLHLDRVVDAVLLLGGQRQRRPEPGVLQRQLRDR